jgi:hypothetical protein
MNPLNAYLALEIISDHQRRAERHRLARPATVESAPGGYDAVTIRRATGADGPALERLAQLEGRPTPAGPALVAEVGRRVLAARSLDGVTLAHPFHPTSELVSLLEMRARHLGSRPRFAAHPARRIAAALRRRRSAFP